MNKCRPTRTRTTMTNHNHDHASVANRPLPSERRPVASAFHGSAQDLLWPDRRRSGGRPRQGDPPGCAPCQARRRLETTWTRLLAQHSRSGHSTMCVSRDRADVSEAKRHGRIGRCRNTNRRFRADEDEWLIELKENHGLPWYVIYRRFVEDFPWRSRTSLQVHYSTKLGNRGLRASSSGQRGRRNKRGAGLVSSAGGGSSEDELMLPASVSGERERMEGDMTDGLDQGRGRGLRRG